MCRYYIQAEKDWWSFADGTETGLYMSTHLVIIGNAIKSMLLYLAQSSKSRMDGFT